MSSSPNGDHLSGSRALAVWFRDLRLWSVTGFRRIHWQWPEEYIRPLSCAIARRTEVVDRSEMRVEDFELITIHFDGSIETRSGKSKKGFKGRLFFTEPGDVVYSKIDLRNGAIAIIPDHLANAVVSSEFPVYKVRREIALSGYIKLLFQTSYFRHAVNGMISGTSGRKRVRPEQIESLKVPLPPIPLQRAILSRWDSFTQRIAHSDNLIAKIEQRLDQEFLEALGFDTAAEETTARAFVVLWKNLSRWSVSANQIRSRALHSYDKYPLVNLGSILNLVQYGSSEKANAKVGTPILRMNNIVDGHLDLSNLKYVPLSDNKRAKLLLRDGDILFNRTNSKELVGKCAVFHEKGDYVFASYLIRLRLMVDQALPDFVASALNSSIGRSQIDALSRQIIGQANINSQEIRSLQIPLPPLKIQRAIVEKASNAQEELFAEKEKMQYLQLQRDQEMEQMILGVGALNVLEEI